ncbi:MAG: hypothetical protein QF877_02525 [Gammaproteobacteria bacterium]|jgi:hypothetical protein|nr:hypothetical protein [Gammaproteobacteria bacterium]|tara:strand:- start:1533 stop:1730 length:198 start_codon:yes stop_codon:yes gene_type:complete
MPMLCSFTPAGKEKLFLPFPHPAKAIGTEIEIDASFDEVCVEIRDKVKLLLTNFFAKEQSRPILD